MHSFAVWAPSAEQVVLHLAGSGSSVPMRRDDDGWWRADVAPAGHGTDYAFSVDGGEPRPDPRSAWQPQGVHAPSRVFDAGMFRWTDDDWPGRDVRGALFYELHVGTFTPEGTLEAARQKLDHLVDLGVDVVQLMPVAAFPGRWGWGYDGVDLFAVHEPYGGPEALQRFVDACHSKGLAVALDVVYNHLGPSGNYLSQFGPYFTRKHETPWGHAVNLDDEGCEQARRFLIDNALRWFRDFHLDALRLDAVHALVDDSPVHLLAQLSTETAALSKELGRPLGLVAESDLNDSRMVRPVEEGGLGMTAQWSDDFHHALHALLTGERQGYYVDFGSLPTFAHAETRVFVHEGGYSTFRGKDWGSPVDPGRDRGHSFLAYDQNHDQVGNRAVGDRPTATVTPGLAAVSAALVLTSPYTPMLFMGEEWAASTPWQFFTDHSEPDLAAAIREGRRREFAEHGWSGDQVPDPQDPATRDASVLRWGEVDDPQHRRMLDWYRELVALRRSKDDLCDDRLDRVFVRFDDKRRWLVVERGALRVVVNLAGEAQAVPLGAAGKDVLAAWDGAELDGDEVRLPAGSVAVVRTA